MQTAIAKSQYSAAMQYEYMMVFGVGSPIIIKAVALLHMAGSMK